MSEPFVGEIQIFAFPFAPQLWSFCNGATMAIRQATALYSLFGTQFGGDGVTTFGLPNLVTRGACGTGQSPGNSPRRLGDTFGVPNVSLTPVQTPQHTHTLPDYQPLGGTLLSVPVASAAIGFNDNITAFAAPGTTVTMDPNMIGVSGAGVAHENRQPYLGLNYCVALVGNYPDFS